MSSTHTRSTQRSWDEYRRYEPFLSTGTSTLSKRPKFEPDEPCYIERGKGCRVWDVDGNEYIDFRNALGPITLGYCFPAVDEAIRAQLEKGILFGHPTILEGEVARMLVEAVPSAEKVRYLKTGGEAMAASFKVARAVTGRDRIYQCGYNGWLNSLALGGAVLPRMRQDVPLGVPLDLARLHRMLPWGDLEPWEKAFAEEGDQVAAVAISYDYYGAEQAREFVRGLRALTERHGALFIIDEIVTGFRLAKGGLHEYCGVDVDMAVFSKGIANGMPLSALAGKGRYLDIIDRAPISSTFSGEALSLAAAKAALCTYRDHDVIGHIARMGERLQRGLNEIFERHDYPLVSTGLTFGPILANREGNPKDDGSPAMQAFMRAAYRNGVSLYTLCYTNFSHREADIDEALERLDAAVREARA